MPDITICFKCPVRKFYSHTLDMHIDYKDCPVECPYDRIEPVKKEESIVHCKDCKHLMFSDMYGECSKGYLSGIVRPEDSCGRGERKEKK